MNLLLVPIVHLKFVNFYLTIVDEVINSDMNLIKTNTKSPELLVIDVNFCALARLCVFSQLLEDRR